jgi:hypothetical protein
MSMNSIVDIDDYDQFNAHLSVYDRKRPLYHTTQSLIYPLQSNDRGVRQFVYDKNGLAMSSPRSV